jgi:RHS repeat-associated protein
MVSVTGTSVVDTVYEYSVLSSGNIATKVRTGDVVNSPRYQVTENDWAGRTVKVSTPSPTGTGEVHSIYAYEPRTRLIESVANPQGTVLYRRPWFDSSLTLSGQDADADTDLAPASNDRIGESRQYFVLEGGYWWSVNSRKQYDQDSSDASAVTSISKSCLHGQPDGVAEKSVRIAPTGETVTTTVAYNRTTKTRTSTESTSGVSTTAVVTDVNGLVASHKSYDTSTAATFYYDGLGRLFREVSPRGEITSRSYHADGSLKSVTDHAGKITSYSYYGPAHVSAGKIASVTNPEGKTVTYGYDDLGNVIEEAGSAAYKVTYQYDDYGAKWKMFTWRDTVTSDTTEWSYQAGTGLLVGKKDAANKSVTYTYDAAGRVATRTWARGVSTTYSYNDFGDLTGIDYSDATPDVGFANIDRLGRPRAVTQAGLGSEVLAYMPGKPGLQSRYYAGATGSGLTIHKLLPGRGIRYSALDSAGRSSGFLETASTTASSYSTSRTLGYGYDTAGRLSTITDGSQSVAYSYHTDSSLISTVQNKTSGTAWFEEQRYYDIPGRLTGIRSKRQGSSTAELTTYAYDYDSLGRRTKSTFQDGSHWEYGYNDRSEVTSATRKTASGTEVTPLNSSYTYDGIGNRLTSTSGVLGNHTYTPNSLNQYATVTTGNSRSAVGRADSTWTVEVNSVAASRIGDLYHRTLTASNGSAPVWQSVVTRRSTGTPTNTGHFWFAKASTTPAYDDDGNLLSDGRNGLIDEGRWVYLWDAENRLIQMESTAAAVTAGMPYTKLTFEYNWEGKRVARHVWRGGNSGSPTFLNSRRWLYEGWNPVVEFTGTSATAATGATAAALNRYTWGLDLGDAGERIGKPGHLLQRAGGVGGLVLQTTISGGVMERPSYDGNGNIVAWTKSNAGTPTSRREYDAFGNVVMSEGASPSAFGFSTKIEDAQSGLLYYGYRYYDPATGRWPSRDPIEEDGGVNLHGFVSNGSTNGIDILGQKLELYHAPSADVKKLSEYPGDPVHVERDVSGVWLVSWSGREDWATCDDCTLSLKGKISGVIYLDDTAFNVGTPPVGESWVMREPIELHERRHEKISEETWNAFASSVNPMDGLTFESPEVCEDWASWINGLGTLWKAIETVKQLKFDDADYGLDPQRKKHLGNLSDSLPGILNDLDSHLKSITGEEG